jgi:hypothetical protein
LAFAEIAFGVTTLVAVLYRQRNRGSVLARSWCRKRLSLIESFLVRAQESLIRPTRVLVSHATSG